mmetsp:Transcript_5485/g.13531  ORF Transcript_5485/g.13531 Transcript_5485/m.13531 type:complete len:107 (-) Transcript_5485:2023-2343(-)
MAEEKFSTDFSRASLLHDRRGQCPEAGSKPFPSMALAHSAHTLAALYWQCRVEISIRNVLDPVRKIPDHYSINQGSNLRMVLPEVSPRFNIQTVQHSGWRRARERR